MTGSVGQRFLSYTKERNPYCRADAREVATRLEVNGEAVGAGALRKHRNISKRRRGQGRLLFVGGPQESHRVSELMQASSSRTFSACKCGIGSVDVSSEDVTSARDLE
jgi:hypothetical protein